MDVDNAPDLHVPSNWDRPAAASPRPSILSLPTELLVMIFHHVYFQSLDTLDFFLPLRNEFESYWTAAMFNAFYPEGAKWAFEADLGSRRFFPYNIAAVCPRWRSILSAVPKYWTRLVMHVGHDATSIADVQSYLAWSEDLPITVAILRREGYETPDPMEAFRVASVTRLLAPHFHRFKSLDIRVVDSMSLPTLGTDICGVAPLLTSLQLTSTMDSGGRNRPPMAEESVLETPALKGSVSLDGENFRAILSSSAWPAAFSNVTTLKISNHASRAGIGEDISLSSMVIGLRQMDSLYHLEIQNVSFAATRDDITPDSRFFLALTSVTLIALTEDNLREFFRTIYLGHTADLHIVSCAFRPINYRCHYVARHLFLENVTGDILDFLGAGHILRLSVSNSPSFDDNILEQMISRPQKLCYLRVHNCSNISGSGLRRLAGSRQTKSAPSTGALYEDEYDPEIASLTDIFYDGPVSEGDLLWFDEVFIGVFHRYNA
ncbi:hypothetical protein PLICRDRAFT_91225 [Plicaturopsis crispa FD-325 SS-3]|nr:hypothetical protein PLICRDRAFT_91225 [Plicaturopsis crispa FD-325 SS-3]